MRRKVERLGNVMNDNDIISAICIAIAIYEIYGMFHKFGVKQ